MPNPADDPTTFRARERSRLGLSREINVLRTDHHKEPTSGAKGYSIEKRIACLQFVNQFSVAAASREFKVSKGTIYRWIERIDPLQMTGNNERVFLTGLDQFLLTMCIYLHPRSTADEQATFIYANGGARAYSRQQISKRLNELGVRRKKCSIEAYQAFTPRNRLRARLFFTRGPRLGIQGVRRFKLTDTDEAKFMISKFQSKRGWGYKTQRVRDPGFYSKNAMGVNLIMTVEPGNPYLPNGARGSLSNPRKWWRITLENTNQVVFSNYIDSVLSDIEQNPIPNGMDDERYLMWDNLSAHLTALVTATVEIRPTHNTFVPIRRPPYQPKYAPIEYIFGEIGQILGRKCAKDWDQERLINELHNACVMVGLNGSLDRTFRHCGYIW